MTTSQLCICLAIVAYLAVMLGIGIWCAKKNNSVDDFYLGGRKLGPFVTAMSAEASDMSSWLLMGLPGVAYLSGLAEASWTAIGLAVGTYLNWLIVARRIRRYSHRLGAITVPQFFSKRWKDERNLLSAIAAVVIIVFFIPYLASGFSACGKLFASLFGTNYLTAMIISGAVIVIYTVTGGFLAASFTDLVQSIIMTVALLIILIFATGQAGGMDAVISNAQSLTGYLSPVSYTHLDVYKRQAPEMASVNHSVGGILQTGADVRNPAVLTKKVHLVDDGITIIACHQGMEIFDQQSGHYDTLLSTFQYRGKKDKGQRRNQSGGRFCGLRSVKAACRRAVASFSRPQSGRPGSLPHSPRRS